MKKLLVLLLAVAMVFAFAACGSHVETEPDNTKTTATTNPTTSTDATPEDPEELSVVGSWTATIAVDGQLMGLNGMDVALEMMILADLCDDGLFTMRIDEDALEVAAEQFFQDALDEMVEMVYAESGMNALQFEAVFQQNYGMSVREYCQMAMGEVSVEDVMSQLDNVEEICGEYTVSGNKLIMTVDSVGMEFTYALTANTLRLTSNDPEFLNFADSLHISALEFVRN